MKKKFLYVSLMALAFASCSNEEVMVEKHEPVQNLKIQVGVHQSESRSLVEDAYFKGGVSLGLFLEKTGGGQYDGKDYINAKYTSTGDVAVVDGVASGQTWGQTEGETILLSGTSGDLYAYYPYKSGLDNFEEIEISTEDQDDWMYASKVTGLSNSNPEAKLVMNHALTAVKVVIKNSNYGGEGKVSGIKIQSPSLGTEGIFNAKTGVVTVNEGNAGTADEMVFDETTITAEGKSFVHMMLPTQDYTGDNNLVVTVTMDGKTFSNTVTKDILQEAFENGNMYKLTLTATAKGFVLGEDTNDDGVIDDKDEPAVTIVTWGDEISLGEQNMTVVP